MTQNGQAFRFPNHPGDCDVSFHPSALIFLSLFIGTYRLLRGATPRHSLRNQITRRITWTLQTQTYSPVGMSTLPVPPSLHHHSHARCISPWGNRYVYSLVEFFSTFPTEHLRPTCFVSRTPYVIGAIEYIRRRVPGLLFPDKVILDARFCITRIGFGNPNTNPVVLNCLSIKKRPWLKFPIAIFCHDVTTRGIRYFCHQRSLSSTSCPYVLASPNHILVPLVHRVN